jgi:hypothetical protein
MLPLDVFPAIMHTNARVWGVDAFAALVRHSAQPPDVLPQLGALLAMAAALLGLASWRLHQSITG